MLATIVSFFKDRHLDLFKMSETIDTQQSDENYKQITAYFKSQKSKEKFEGFWVSEANHIVLAMKKTKSKPLTYSGYVIECRKNSALYPGMVFCELEKQQKFFFTRAMSSATGMSFYVNSYFRNDSVLTTGPYNKWRKLDHYTGPILPSRPQSSETTTGLWLSQDSYLITIPNSTATNGRIVDSLLQNDSAILRRARNLIVDIRNNTGGKVAAYTPLYPILYTHPIPKINSSVYCTEDEAKKIQNDIEKYIADGGTDSTYIKSWLDFAKMEIDSAGKFVPMPKDTIKFDKVLPYPKNIGIIINYGCQSAAEIFLLHAQQSEKVRLFGEHTMGAIDYLDFYPITLPSGKYKIYIATTRRNIPPGESKLDGIGIVPDVKIGDEEPNWPDFVKRYYEEH